ncbi:unnamed protein product [Cuscuta campestris]|uniref:1,3-beta-glucan synthase component FKS1-like domain-containing protein n=1 Tax=Cuscuta campestris TaxID=132261 RepID=A0A484KWF3_9ASTE|nr:unnamed protein product [Cuscuta campestris]
MYVFFLLHRYFLLKILLLRVKSPDFRKRSYVLYLSSECNGIKLGFKEQAPSFAGWVNSRLSEARHNDNGRAPHSAWRNYDDFNEYFWSLNCFELSWPWRITSPFFLKPTPRSKV